MKRILTVGMCTYDDYNGVYFSVQALRMYHEIFKTDDAEILVVDNNPDSQHGEATKKFVSGLKNCRYIAYTKKITTACRNEIFNSSSGKYCMSIDCHVFLVPGAIDAILRYYAATKDCKDIVQGPLIYDYLTNISTHFHPQWRGSMYGTWETDHESLKTGNPFEIPMQGLGMFSCEVKNWPSFNEEFKGFGGEEGYIHEKIRKLGGKAICVPQAKWMHRFCRPDGVKYPLILEDRIWNYFVGWLELTKDPEHEVIKGAYEHFKDKIPPGSIDNILEMAKQKIL